MKSNEINDFDIKGVSRYFKAVISDNTALSRHFRLLSISPIFNLQPSAFTPAPGQFYMIQTGSTYDPLLKRPFSIFGYEDNILRFLYRIRGKGTSCLSSLKNGDVINLIGPLGNGYPEPHGDFIAVAGGIGIASLIPFIKKFKGRAYLFYGAKNKEELIMLNDARSFSKELFIATDDGSEGKKGLITDVFKNSLIPSAFLYACGPTPMLKELSGIAADKGMKCYASLEEHMACGVGACLGCVIKFKRQGIASSALHGEGGEDRRQAWVYRRVCKEGPVFDTEDIVWK